MESKQFRTRILMTGLLLIVAGAFFLSWNLDRRELVQEDPVNELDAQTSSLPQPEVGPAAGEPAAEAAASMDLRGLPEKEKKIWTEFQDILSAKNDNDPRIDQNYRQMSPQLHRLLIEKYQQLPMEQRSERGLIAFLIARDVRDISDLLFIKEIFSESPCLSLENCASRSHSDPHLSGVDQNTMNYPQLISLYQLEKQLAEHPEKFESSNMKDILKATIERARQFDVPVVSKKANELERKLGQ